MQILNLVMEPVDLTYVLDDVVEVDDMAMSDQEAELITRRVAEHLSIEHDPSVGEMQAAARYIARVAQDLGVGAVLVDVKGQFETIIHDYLEQRNIQSLTPYDLDYS